MPKLTLEFNLPEETEEFEHAHKGLSYSIALDNMDGWLRNKIKYVEMPEHVRAIYEEVRTKLNEFRYDG